MVKSNKEDDSKVCLQDFSGPNSSSLNIKWFVCFFFFSVQGGYLSHGNFMTCFRKEEIRVTFLLFSQMPSA